MLTFNEDLHEYRYRGAIVPGVTRVLEPLYEWLKEVPSYVLERKAEIGRQVHIACELHDKDDLDWDTLDPVVRPYVESYVSWLSISRAKVMANEEKVWNRVHCYAGQEDRVFQFDGRTWDVDLKTTAEISKGVGVQTAAYQQARWSAINGTPPDDGRAALQLMPDGKPAKFVPFTDRDDWPTFLSLLNLHRWRMKHGCNR